MATVELWPSDPLEAARAAGLHYVTGRKKGLTRRRRGQGFSYHTPQGGLVTDDRQRERIESLVIPPAWEDVWISADPKGHLQASGYDERGRKQYLYHPLYRAIREATKFNSIADFARALPRVRGRVRKDLKQSGLPKEKVTAAIVRVIDAAYIRVGNERYRRANQSYGLTTLLSKHIVVHGRTIDLEFTGKSGKDISLSIKDRHLARILARCRELPGKNLFQYQENGARGSVDSGDVNDYLQRLAGDGFTAKHFRTWGGGVLAAAHLRTLGPADSETARKRNVCAAVKHAAAVLFNTPATCRKYYIHPAITEAYLAGRLIDLMDEADANDGPHRVRGLRKLEQAVLYVLEQKAAKALDALVEEAQVA